MLAVLQRTLNSLLATKPELTEADTRSAVRLFLWEGVMAVGMATLQGGVFLVGFALALGATNYEVGLITTIVLLAQFTQLGGLALVKAFGQRRLITVISAGLSRLLWVMIIITPLLFLDRGFTFVLMWLILASAVGAIAGPPWNSLFRDVVPDEARSKLLSRRLSIGTFLGLILTLAGGWFLDVWKHQFPAGELYGYSILFAIGLLLGMGGIVALMRIPEPTLHDDGSESIFKLLGKPLQDKNFRQLLVFIGIWSFAVNMAAPFFVVYMLKRIELPLLWVTIFTVTSQVSNILFLGIWARLADRFSNKSVLGASGTLFLIAIFLWTFTTMPERHHLTIPLLFFIHLLSGMSIAGVAISSANIALKLSPKGQGHSFMTTFGLVASLAGCLGPVVGGTLADSFEAWALSVPLQLQSATHQVSLMVISLKALDFVFLLAFILGLYSLQRLSRVVEGKETSERQILDEFMQELAMPLRAYSSVAGVRRLVYMPLAAVSRTVSKVRKKTNGDQPTDVEPGTE